MIIDIHSHRAIFLSMTGESSLIKREFSWKRFYLLQINKVMVT